MKTSFQLALREVLKHEGGYVNHPKDPGGATNKGITQHTYDSYRGKSRAQSVKLITDAEVAAIYKSRYWDAVCGDELHQGLDYAMFDFAVNSGPQRAIRFLQSILGLKLDGVMGPSTLAAARGQNTEWVVLKLCDKRLDYLKFLPTWPTFGKGWAQRVSDVKSLGMRLAKGPLITETAAKAPTKPVGGISTPSATQVPKALSKPASGLPTGPKSVKSWLASLFH